MKKQLLISLMTCFSPSAMWAMQSAFQNNDVNAQMRKSSDFLPTKPQKRDSAPENHMLFSVLAVANKPIIIKTKSSKKDSARVHIAFPVLVQQHETRQFSIKLIIVNEEQGKLIYKTQYLNAVRALAHHIKKESPSDSWTDVLQFTKTLLPRSKHVIWGCLLIDSLYELYSAHGFTKLILAFELNEEGRLNEWIRDYLRNYKENINGNICAANTTALISAVSQTNDEGDKEDDPLCLLVEIGKVDLDRTNDDKSTALMFAASLNHVKATEFLLRKGANMDLTDFQGHTALHLATAAQHPEAVACLLRYKANTEIATLDTQFTPLVTAIFQGNASIVELLLKNGANANVMANENNTAFMLAITMLGSIVKSPELYETEDLRNAQKIVLNLLAHKQTDCTIRVGKGKNALTLADIYNLNDIAAAIKAREDSTK